MIHHLKRATRLFLFYMLIALAIAISLLRLFLFALEFYKQDLEHKIFELTSIPVEIGKLQANLRGINPEIILKDIQTLVTDEHGNPSIELEQVRVGIDVTQLLSTRQLIPSSWLTLVGAKLSIVRHQDGTLSIIGLNSDDTEQPLWLLSGGRYEVLKSDITWFDKVNQRSPVSFSNVDLLIRNDAESKTHELHLLTRLPERYGNSLRLSMSVQGNIFATENLSGWVYAEGSAIDLTEVFSEELPFGIKITDHQNTEKNESSFKLWSQWEQSSLKALSGSIEAKNIVLKQKEKKKNFDINQFDTEFSLSFNNDGWQFGVKDFTLTTGNHEWSPMEFSLAANQQLTNFAASATHIELQALIEVVDFFVPLSEKNQGMISDLELKGQLKNFSVYADQENQNYAINGGFNNIFVNAISDFPQIKNLTGEIKGTNESGKISFFSSNGSLFYPELFRKAISIENLDGTVEWQQQADNWLVNSKSLVLNTNDFETISKMSLTIPKNDEAVFMDLQTSFANVEDISLVSDYYPVAIMQKDVVNWLDNAFVAGEINKGKLLIYGELNQFPFVDGQGMFEVLFHAKDVELNYSPEWPHLKNLDAEILFTKNAVSVDIAEGHSDGVKVLGASVKIPSFDEIPHLKIKGQFKGSIVDGLTFLQQTPLRESVEEIVDAITPSGLTQVSLDMEIPLSESTELKLDGVATMNKAGLTIHAIDLDVSDFKGELRFSEKGMFSDNLKAQSLGYPLGIKLDSDENKTVIVVDGETDYLQLKQQFSFLASDLIRDEQITGSSVYTVILNLPTMEEIPADLTIKTNLLGVDFDFPASLKKQAVQAKPLLVTIPLNEEELLPVNINYNNELKAAININRKQNAIYSAHIIYGTGKTAFLKQKGMVVHIDQTIFDGSEWMGLVKQALSKEEDSETEMTSLEFKNLVLKAKEFQWQGKGHGPFEMILQRQEEQWRGNILSAQARGAFIIPFKPAAENKIKLEMELLNLTQLMAIKMQTNDIKADNMPLIDVVSQQLWWKDMNLGKLDIATEKLINGVRFKHINVTSKGYQIKLNGDWIETDEGSVTNIYGDFSAKDFGKVLSQFDITDDIKETHGNFGFFAAWQGLPYQFSLPTIDAEIELDLKEGRISSIEPGFGRLLGLVAMGQWVKRLSLDFSDIYKAGLSFNKITGRVKLGQGKLSSRNILVDAIPANISIRGGINLLDKTMNQRIQVVPKSSSAIPIAGPIVGGIAGAITQVFDENYKEGYFFGSEYEVNGKWDDLKVTPLHEQDGLLKKTWTGLTDFSWMKQKTK